MKNRVFKILIAAALVAPVSLGLLGLERTVRAQDAPGVSQPDPMQFARSRVMRFFPVSKQELDDT